jgi:CDP-diacylglycerol--glycerol-3-phosphate 3-phosphatidyltransferase
VDGHIARRHGTTRSGAFLDPLADKVLVLGMLIAFVAEGTFWWLPVAVITARELGIQAFRSYWVRRGLAVPATVLAKAKTIVQQVAVGFALLPATGDDVTWLANVALWVAVVLTVVTGVQYVVAGSRFATTAGNR